MRPHDILEVLLALFFVALVVALVIIGIGLTALEVAKIILTLFAYSN